MSLANGITEPEEDPDWEAYEEIVWGDNTQAAETRRERYEDDHVSYDSLVEEVIAASLEPEYETVADQIQTLRNNWFEFIDYETESNEISREDTKTVLKHVPDHLGERYMMDDCMVAFLAEGGELTGKVDLDVEQRGEFLNAGIEVEPDTWNPDKSRFEYSIGNGDQHEVRVLRKAEEKDWDLFYRNEFFREMAEVYEASVKSSGSTQNHLHPIYLKAFKGQLDRVATPKSIQRDKENGDEDVPIANESFREGSIVLTWDSDFTMASHERLKFYENIATPDKVSRGDIQ